MKTNTTDFTHERQPRMTRIARMKKDFPTRNPEPTCRDGARARRVQTEPQQQNALLIRVIREIRGFHFGIRLIRLLFAPALIAGLNLVPTGPVRAQTFTTLHSFTATLSGTNSDGAYPAAGLITNSSGNTLYGTARVGGASGNVYVADTFNNTIRKGFLPPPQLTILLSGVPPSAIVLTWPAYIAGFTLQSTTNLVSPVVWSTNSPAPVVIGGQNTVTNSISGPQQFYRLSH